MYQISKVLNVAEKPSVAKHITNLLTQNSQLQHTHSKFNQIYKFNLNMDGNDVEMYFTSVTGHLTELKYDDKYKKWNEWDPLVILKDAQIYTQVPEEKINLLNNLKQLSKTCNKLILWLDCDREGENIAFEVVDVCKKINPRLEILRARFSAITNEEIMKALQNLNPPNENLSNSVEVRKEIDLRIGASFTRFQSMLLQRVFSLQGVISYGPCQIPTLGFVVQRHLEIEEFIRKPFWFIQCVIDEVEFKWERGHLFDKMITALLLKRCYDEYALVTEVKQKDTTKYKPVPLATIELEKLGSKKLRMSPHKVMEIAEKLYTQGYISYPRTETNQFPKSMNLKNCLQSLKNHPQLGQFTQNLLDGQFETPRIGAKNDGAHPPIYPVKVMQLTDQNEEEYKVYDLILRHFLACCSKNAKGLENSIKIKVKDEEFSKTGITITQKNYLEVYIFDKWAEFQMPLLKRGERAKVQLEMKQGSTQPPNPITESELITLMDKHGIGTDATIHEHIKTIQERQYATKHGQIIKPSKLGIALVQGYKSLGFTLHEPYLRALMEERMNQVALGTADKRETIEKTILEMAEILKDLQGKQQTFAETVGQHLQKLANFNEETLEQPDFSICGKCSNLLTLKLVNDQRDLFCKTCNASYLLPKKGEIQKLPQQCPICQFQVLSIHNKEENKSKYTICPNCYTNTQGVNKLPCFLCKFEACQFSGASQKREDSFTCVSCQQPLTLKMELAKPPLFYCSCGNKLIIPQDIETVKKVEIPCEICQNHMFNIKFYDDVLLFGRLGQRRQNPEEIYCLLPECDPDLNIIWKTHEKKNPVPRNSAQYNNQQQYQQNQQNQQHHQQNQQNQQNQQQQQQRQQDQNRQNHFQKQKFEKKKYPSGKQEQQKSAPQQQDKLQTIQCYKCKAYGHYANTCNQTNKENNQQQQNQAVQQNQAATQNKHKNNANQKKDEKQKKDKQPCPECGQLRHNAKSSCSLKRQKSQ